MYEIYTKKSCGFCIRAKDLLNLLGEDFTEINIEEEGNIEKLTERLGARPRTVPQIFHEGKLVGGYTELTSYVK